MAIIYNIADYRNKKRGQTPEEQFRQLISELGTWDSFEEEYEYYNQLAIQDRAEMEAFQKEFPDGFWKANAKI